jgi:hypothetical protein
MNPIEMQNRVKQATRSQTRYVFSMVNREFLKIDVPVTKTPYKIAVLFSGGLRNFKITQEWANKFLINPLQADVFFHGWCNKEGVENNEKDILNYCNIKAYKIMEREKISIPIPDVLKNKFPNVVNIGYGMELAEHILGQLFNIKNCFDLMEKYEQEHGLQYDIVIRARPDVFWYATLEDKDLDFIMKSDCLATPQHYMSTICGENINDQFAMGRRDLMRAYTRMFDMVESYGHSAPNDSPTEFYVTHHIINTMRVPIHDIDMTFMLDYPADYELEKGFTNFNYRNKEQNDSKVAMDIVNNIVKSNT